MGLVVTGLEEKKGLTGELKFLFPWNEKFSEILCCGWTVSRCDPLYGRMEFELVEETGQEVNMVDAEQAGGSSAKKL